MNRNSLETKKRLRHPHFSLEERRCLLTVLSNYQNIIENKECNSYTYLEKEKAWRNVTKVYNSKHFGHFRSSDTLKRAFELMKKEARKECLKNAQYREFVNSVPSIELMLVMCDKQLAQLMKETHNDIFSSNMETIEEIEKMDNTSEEKFDCIDIGVGQTYSDIPKCQTYSDIAQCQTYSDIPQSQTSQSGSIYSDKQRESSCTMKGDQTTVQVKLLKQERIAFQKEHELRIQNLEAELEFKLYKLKLLKVHFPL